MTKKHTSYKKERVKGTKKIKSKSTSTLVNQKENSIDFNEFKFNLGDYDVLKNLNEFELKNSDEFGFSGLSDFKDFEFNSNDFKEIEFNPGDFKEFEFDFNDLKKFDFNPKDLKDIEFNLEDLKKFDFNPEELKKQNLLEGLKNDLKKSDDCLFNLPEFVALKGSKSVKRANKKASRNNNPKRC